MVFKDSYPLRAVGDEVERPKCLSMNRYLCGIHAVTSLLPEFQQITGLSLEVPHRSALRDFPPPAVAESRPFKAFIAGKISRS